MLSATEWKILGGIVLCALALGLGAIALAWLNRWLDHVDGDWELTTRHQAHVCAHCGRELIPGTYPPIMSVCPPHVLDCPRPKR